MSKEKVKISLKSKISQEGQVFKVKEAYLGTYKCVNGSHFLRMADKEKGMMTVKVDPDSQEVTCLFERHAMKRIHFVPNAKTSLFYQLPQESLLLDVDTKNIQLEMGPKGLTKLVIDYALEQAGSPFGTYQLSYQLTYLS